MTDGTERQPRKRAADIAGEGQKGISEVGTA